MRKTGDAALLRAAAIEIKARRAALGISQEELAHRAGLNRTSIARVEIAQTQLSMSGIFRVAAALDTDVSNLMDAIGRRYAKEQRGSKKASTPPPENLN